VCGAGVSRFNVTAAETVPCAALDSALGPTIGYFARQGIVLQVFYRYCELLLN
jgi:hypothetical protein